jgi:hypothetical protein
MQHIPKHIGPSGSALVGVVIVACQRGVTRTCQAEKGDPALWLRQSAMSRWDADSWTAVVTS